MRGGWSTTLQGPSSGAWRLIGMHDWELGKWIGWEVRIYFWQHERRTVGLAKKLKVCIVQDVRFATFNGE